MSPLDPTIGSLMLQTVEWERFQSQDGYGDPTFAPAEEIRCHIEEGTEAVRTPDGTVLDPRTLLIFDAGDERVQEFTSRDRFTVAGIGQGKQGEPVRITPVYGPDGDAWVVEVTL